MGLASPPIQQQLLQLPSRAQVVDALKQAARSASDRTIWVFPAGNSGLAIPSGSASYAIYIPELRNHVLAAVALGADGAIWSNSNRCGAAAPALHCSSGKSFQLRIISSTNAPTYATTYGTSNAAPTVAAALAILKQAFPSIGNDELVTRLLSHSQQVRHIRKFVNLRAGCRRPGYRHSPRRTKPNSDRKFGERKVSANDPFNSPNCCSHRKRAGARFRRTPLDGPGRTEHSVLRSI